MLTGRQVVFTAVGEPLRIEEVEVPAPTADQMVVRVDLAGVCGTDAHRLHGDTPPVGWPMSLGHEAVGTVVALGERLTTDRAGAPLEVGSRVYWTPGGPCGRCSECTVHMRGCSRMRYPFPADEPNPATYRDFATIERDNPLFVIPDGVSNEAAIAFGCALPTAAASHACVDAIKPGETVVVQGNGPVGLATALLAGLSPASQVIVIGRGAKRLEWARRLGGTEVLDLDDTTSSERVGRVLELTEGRGAEVVFEAAGRIEAFPEGLDLLARRGRYVIAGLYSGTATVPFNPVTVNNRSLTITGTLDSGPEMVYRALSVVGAHGDRLDFASLVDARFAIDATEEAIELASAGEATKPVIDMALGREAS